MKKFVIRFSLLSLIVVLIGLCFIPLMKDTKYGLDLQGGFEVLYEVSPLEGNKLTPEMLSATYKTISRRIDVLGVTEPDIIIEGDSRIRVKLAGIRNREEARNILSRAATLSFRDTSDNLLMTSSVLKVGNVKTNYQEGKPVVALPISDVDKFHEVTSNVSKMKDNRIVIWLDFVEGEDSFVSEQKNCGSLSSSKCLSAAYVSQAFTGDVVIQGSFTKEEATTLAELINSGSLPTKLTEISSKMVGASFGENSLHRTYIAGLIGAGIIILFLTIIYKFAGFIAGLGIIIYTFLTFLVFWVIGGVLTLPGIASLILGIGMAVDANILSFERIKEELWSGKSLSAAFKLGNKRSLSTILDANITTLLAAFILFFLGESSVKGFATMLIINIFITILVMVFIIKFVLELFVKTKFFDNRLGFFIGVNKKDISNIEKNEAPTKLKPFKKLEFMKYRKWHLLPTLIIIVIATCCLFTKGLNLGIDYKGGTDITITGKEDIILKDIRTDIDKLELSAVEIDNIDPKTVYIKLEDVLSKDDTETLNDFFSNKYKADVDIGVVSNIVKKELTMNAIYAITLSLIGMIIYVSIRFKFSFAIASIVALIHDVIMVFAVFAIFRIEISVIFIAAILTTIGYSINDTIVIFDRIRETIKDKYNNNVSTNEIMHDIINDSLRGTLTRTIFTTITVIFPVVCLIFFGAYEINNFNIAILIGLIAGVYSTVLLAPQLWCLLESKNMGKEPKKKPKQKKELEELSIKGINA